MALAVGVNGCREAEMKVLGVAATKELRGLFAGLYTCLLYTSDAADDWLVV